MYLTQEVSREASVYRPRSPTRTALYKLLVDRFDHFETIYPERFSKSHGFYRPVISHVVRNYLWCGDLTQGFARVRCPDCHHEYLLAFSCRGRWSRSLPAVAYLSVMSHQKSRPVRRTVA